MIYTSQLSPSLWGYIRYFIREMWAKDTCEECMMDLVDGALLSSTVKPLFGRQSDQAPFTTIKFLGLITAHQMGCERYVVPKEKNKE
jgi:hypothetical protein